MLQGRLSVRLLSDHLNFLVDTLTPSREIDQEYSKLPDIDRMRTSQGNLPV